MSKKFKDYYQNQVLLLPPSLEELIGEKEMVRVVSKIVDGIDISVLAEKFEGGGCPSYHPVMMLKVLIYAYSCGVYSCRKIAKSLRRDVGFMWLSGLQYPDFNTVNRFRSDYLKDVLEQVFAEVVHILLKHEYVKMEDYFIDGTKLEADASKHSYVWSKNTERFKAKVQSRASEIMREVEELNKAENDLYGAMDLPEYGEQAKLSSEDLKVAAQKINAGILNETSPKTNSILRVKARTLEKEAERLKKYEDQQELLGKRNSYSKTDSDATFMKLKNEELRAAYNVQAGTENGFVVGFSVSQNANDAADFIAHMNKRDELKLPRPENVIGDSIYGTEENYLYLAGRKLGSYLKYPTFHKDITGKWKDFSKERFDYEKTNDCFICPGKRKLIFIGAKEEALKSGLKQQLRIYKCESCAGCQYHSKCVKTGGNRTIQVNRRLEGQRREARKNLCSEKGLALRKRRGPEVETVFGDLKQNMGYRRIRLRGLAKASLEMALLFISYNIRKIHNFNPVFALG